MEIRSYVIVGVLAAVAALTTSCEINLNRDRHDDSESFEHNRKISVSDDIRTLDTQIEMGGGRLYVSGTNEYALDSHFEVDDLKDIDIQYREDGSNGNITISHDQDSRIRVGDNNSINDEWDVKLNRSIEQNLDITLAAGESTLDLADFNLRDVKITMGAGENKIDLKNASPESLRLEAGVGNVHLDMSGRWKNDARIRVSGGIGQLVMILPEDANIELEVNGGLGSVNAERLEKRGRMYYQDGDGHRLDIVVNAGIGSLEIITQ